jgi:hypothetical protein
MVTASLLGELADVVEWDGSQKSPRLQTGAAVHELRTVSREMRCRGQRIGDRQPAARDKIKSYLDSAAGTEGGPLTPDARSRWVAAYREVSRAAAEAIGASPSPPSAAWAAYGDSLWMVLLAVSAWVVYVVATREGS